MSDDPLLSRLPSGGSEEEPSPRKPRREFSDLVARVRHSEVSNVTASEYKRAGRYYRKTILLPPEQIEYIDELRRREGVGVLEFYRWLIDIALQQYEAGARPEPVAAAAVEMAHRTSVVKGSDE